MSGRRINFDVAKIVCGYHTVTVMDPAAREALLANPEGRIVKLTNYQQPKKPNNFYHEKAQYK